MVPHKFMICVTKNTPEDVKQWTHISEIMKIKFVNSNKGFIQSNKLKNNCKTVQNFTFKYSKHNKEL